MSLLSLKIGSVLKILLISMTPVLELRGAIPFGVMYNLPIWETILFSVIGNMLPVPFIVLFARRIFGWLKTKGIFRRFAEWSERRVLNKKGVLEKYKAIGLAILVAIPLPGTGAWTGAMLAGLLNMRIKEAFLPILIGVILAAVIVAGVSYGIFGAISLFGIH